MNRQYNIARIVAAFLIASASANTLAQQVNGELGTPSATITVDGKQLPPPPVKFGG